MRTNKQNPKVVFKQYNQHQLHLLPPSLEELIPENHLVRIVNSSIDKLNIEPVINAYKGGGTSSYHPKMLLKVIVYAYTQRIYSSRRIAKSIRENIYFMWLSGNNCPDFRTINRFRSSRLKKTIDEVFSSLIILLIESGYVKLENYFCDGTKIEANANKYSFVWSKATKRYKERLEDQIKELINHIDMINTEENKQYSEKDLEEMGEEAEINEEKIISKINQLNEKLDKINKEIEEKQKSEKSKPDSTQEEKSELKELKSKGKQYRKINKKLNDNYLIRYLKYKRYEKVLGKRNSFSKTDEDATFMRMKEDHMLNGQLKPGYNLQIGTENQFILGYSLHQKSTDTGFLKPHIERFKELTKLKPNKIIADAGYGSLENYEYLAKEEIEAYVKYNYFDREQKKTKHNKKSEFRYDEERDRFVCQAEKYLEYKYNKKRVTDNGYEYYLRIYEASECTGCKFKEQCCPSTNNKKTTHNFALNKHKEKVKEKLLSEEGIELRKQRCIDVETVFGQIKWNMGFKRFLLRGMKKVNVEIGLISLAHNLKKMFNLQNQTYIESYAIK